MCGGVSLGMVKSNHVGYSCGSLDRLVMATSSAYLKGISQLGKKSSVISR